jgi:hypothetical protein
MAFDVAAICVVLWAMSLVCFFYVSFKCVTVAKEYILVTTGVYVSVILVIYNYV